MSDTDKPLTMEELAGLLALCDKATPGPWQQHDSEYCPEEIWGNLEGPFNGTHIHGTQLCEVVGDNLKSDARFIATFNPATVRRLIAAAERSCRRPIADAPRDVILGVDAEGRWASCKYSQSSRCWFDAVGGCFFPIAFLPIPKGGAS